jgi:hypothetical protein
MEWALLGGVVAVALVVIAVLAMKVRTAGKDRNRARGRVRALEADVARLWPYQAVVDAEARAREVAAQAQQAAAAEIGRARGHAGEIVGEAERIAAERKAEAKRSAEEVARRAAEKEAAAIAMLGEATVEASKVMAEARTRAEAIAGDAYKAMRDARHYEETARAMKNIVEGYGDQYIVPTAGLLDELAEELGFAEAGQRLKAARDRTRAMIKAGTAAVCNYVEKERRETAIRFVLDAFNGKVDTALADVKATNHGTLERKLRDAFAVVNENGRAFRDARIQPAYLDARLEELRWAVVAQELKEREREEQRAIKERIREEERAQREFEKARKEAEKEEDVLRKAMEKARKEVDRATDEQKVLYEAKLAELAARLVAAEAKNQRALSMAQQTRAGHVYVISNIGSFGEDVLKIGLTRRLEPLDRIRELGDASVPFDFDVHALIRSEDAPALERELQRHFVRQQVNKVNARKEFFRVKLQNVRELVTSLGHEASFTLAAECREWKETQAIEREMAKGTFDRAAWERQQIAEHDEAVTAQAAEAAEA